jgi:hypothetical protein
MSKASLGGQFTFPGTSLTVQRIGYGATKHLRSGRSSSQPPPESHPVQLFHLNPLPLFTARSQQAKPVSRSV